jgi:hypothetical protein
MDYCWSNQSGIHKHLTCTVRRRFILSVRSKRLRLVGSPPGQVVKAVTKSIVLLRRTGHFEESWYDSSVERGCR